MSAGDVTLTDAEVAHLSRLFEHNHFTLMIGAVEDILAARTPTATGDDLRDRVAALVSDWQANAGSRALGDPTAATWDDAARQLLAALAASSAPVVSRPEAVVKTLEDFRDHGLRCDLNPTMRHDYGLYAAFVDYLRSADENVRARAARALNADSGAP